MKKTYTHVIELDGKEVMVRYDYWPATYGSRFTPPGPEEFNILSMWEAKDGPIKFIPIPDIDSEQGFAELEQIWEKLGQEIIKQCCSY